VDEFGSTLALITLADVLKQLLGEIEDEFDNVKESSMPVETPLVLEGSINLRDLETEYRIALPRGRFQTLAGFVLDKLQQIPRPGKQFNHYGLKFTVLEMVGHRIAQVKIERSMTR
jgi:putative hemolysin